MAETRGVGLLKRAEARGDINHFDPYRIAPDGAVVDHKGNRVPLAEQLRQAVANSDISMKALAERSGLDRKTIQRFLYVENAFVSSVTIEGRANGLGVSVGYRGIPIRTPD